MEYTRGVPVPAHIIAMGTFENRSVITKHDTIGSRRLSLRHILRQKPTPGESVKVSGKLGRWYLGMANSGSFESTVHSSTSQPSSTNSRMYSCHLAATPPAPLTSVVDGIISRSVPLSVMRLDEDDAPSAASAWVTPRARRARGRCGIGLTPSCCFRDLTEYSSKGRIFYEPPHRGEIACFRHLLYRQIVLDFRPYCYKISCHPGNWKFGPNRAGSASNVALSLGPLLRFEGRRRWP